MLNRGATMQAVAQAIAAGGGDDELAVLVVRGRRTRETELSLGYAVADALAAAMEAKLVASLRAQDTVLRIGEHAFVVLLPGVRGRQHAALAAAKLVRALGQPLMLEGWQLHPSVTVGLALYPSDGTDADALCLHADQACHEARNEADGFAFWHRPVHADSFTHDELRDALARNQLELYLQPVLDLHDSRISGYEALARWNHPRIGMVPPPAFVGEAERTGLIGELTRWSLTVALRHLAHDLQHMLLGGFVQFIKAAPARAVSRDLVGVQPAAVDVAEEIVLWSHRGVHVLELHAQLRGTDLAGSRRRSVCRVGPVPCPGRPGSDSRERR